MTMRLKHIALSLTVMFLLSTVAVAGERPNLVLKLTAYKERVVRDASGKLRSSWVEVSAIEPGDLIKYRMSYTNTGSLEARGAVIVDPVPQGTVYVANSAKGDDTEISFSMDGKYFQTAPMLKYRVQLPGAKVQEYEAKPEMYTHVRWKLLRPVPPGASGEVSFLVKAK